MSADAVPPGKRATRRRRRQREQALLKKANELVKKDVGIVLRSLSNREKTLWVNALRPAYRLPEPLDEVGLARVRPSFTALVSTL
jgi:hypothetical protein